jgi:hypothetical protein
MRERITLGLGCALVTNMILSQSKKYGGRLYTCSLNDPFHSFLDSFGMVDLGKGVHAGRL